MLTRHITGGLGVLAAVGLLAGCSNAQTSSSVASGSLPQNAPAAAAHGAADAGSAGTTMSGALAAGAPAIAIGVPPTAEVQRSVRAAYTVPSGTFLTSFDGVIARAVTLGGFVASSATTPAPGGRIVAGSVTLEIPATSIANFLNAMPPTFVASSIDFSSIDHAAAFVDLNAELASAHAQLHALDALFARATTLADIATVEQQIEAVQVQVDTYQGQLNALVASVAMSAATVALTERGAALVAAAPGPLNNGLSGGWHNAVQVTGALLDGLVTAVPVLVIVALVLAAWRLIPRRLRRSTPPLP